MQLFGIIFFKKLNAIISHEDLNKVVPIWKNTNHHVACLLFLFIIDLNTILATKIKLASVRASS